MLTATTSAAGYDTFTDTFRDVFGDPPSATLTAATAPAGGPQ